MRKICSVCFSLLACLALVLPVMAQDQPGQVTNPQLFLPLVTKGAVQPHAPLTQADCDRFGDYRLSGLLWPSGTKFSKLSAQIYRMRQSDFAVNDNFFANGTILLTGGNTARTGVCLPHHYTFTTSLVGDQQGSIEMTWQDPNQPDRPDWAGFLQNPDQVQVSSSTIISGSYALVDQWFIDGMWGTVKAAEVKWEDMTLEKVVRVPPGTQAESILGRMAVGLTVLYALVDQAYNSTSPVVMMLPDGGSVVSKTDAPADQETTVHIRCFAAGEDPIGVFRNLDSGEGYRLYLNAFNANEGCIIASAGIDLGGRIGNKPHTWRAAEWAVGELTAEKETREAAVAAAIAEAELITQLAYEADPDHDERPEPTDPLLQCPQLEQTPARRRLMAAQTQLAISYKLRSIPADDAHLQERQDLIQFSQDVKERFYGGINVEEMVTKYSDVKPRNGMKFHYAQYTTQDDTLNPIGGLDWNAQFWCSFLVFTDDLGVSGYNYGWVPDHHYGPVQTGLTNGNYLDLIVAYLYDYDDMVP